MDTKKKPLAQNMKEEAQTLVEKVKAKGSQAKGAVKEAFGKATGNTKMKVEGKTEKAIGQVKEATAKSKDKARDTAEKVKKVLNRMK